MSRIIDYVVVLEDGVRKRHYHESDRGNVVCYAVQLEVRIEGIWTVVVRYDCSHGFSHIDRYDRKRVQTKTILNLSFESALTLGDWDIGENWMTYKQGFLKGETNE